MTSPVALATKFVRLGTRLRMTPLSASAGVRSKEPVSRELRTESPEYRATRPCLSTSTVMTLP